MVKDKIVTFGEVLLRWSKNGFRRLSQGKLFNGNYGGSEANVAVSLSMLNNKVEYVTCLPDDLMGKSCLQTLRYYGLNLAHVCVGGERLGTYYFEASAAMRNSQVVYDRNNSAFYSLRPGMIHWDEIFQDAKIFHCSGITCAISQDAQDATFEAVRKADEMGLYITCDINYRKNLWKYGADAHETLHRLMQYSDFIFGDQNEWELASGLPHIPFEAKDSQYVLDLEAYLAYFRQLQKQFPRCRQMMMALRNQITTNNHTLTGLLYVPTSPSDGTLYATRIEDIQPIIDPMGVGDAFVAAYIHAHEKWKDAPQRCLDFALTASALKNSVPGDFNLLTEEEILEAEKSY